MMIVNHAGLSLFCGAAHFPPPLQSYSGDVHPRNLSHRWGDAACANRHPYKGPSPWPLWINRVATKERAGRLLRANSGAKGYSGVSVNVAPPEAGERLVGGGADEVFGHI